MSVSVRPVSAAVLMLTALGVGLALGGWRSAQAQDGAGGQELLCRVFAVDPSRADGARLHTGDPTEEVGQWVQTQRQEGWEPWTADFEMGVKGNGFPVAYTQVCLARGRPAQPPAPR